MDDSSGGKCEPVIVFKCMDLSIGQRVNVFRTRYSSAGIATRSYVTLYVIKSLLSMRRWSKGRQFRSFNIAVTLEVYLYSAFACSGSCPVPGHVILTRKLHISGKI